MNHRDRYAESPSNSPDYQLAETAPFFHPLQCLRFKFVSSMRGIPIFLVWYKFHLARTNFMALEDSLSVVQCT